MMASRTTITILGGAGAIGKRHVEHVLQNPFAELHSLVDPTSEGTQMALLHGVPIFESLEMLIASFAQSKPQAAIIATPSQLHVQQAVKLLEHRVHLLIEKPVCTSVKEGKELLATARASGGATILSGYHRRFNPHVIALKNMVDSGKLGRVVAVQGTWAVRKPAEYFSEALWRAKKGSGGTLLTNMSHEIDLFRHFFGEIIRVYLELGPNLREYDIDETGAATIRFASGAVGTFLFSDTALSPFSFEGGTGENPKTIAPSGQNVYRVLGTKGSVEFPSLMRYHYDATEEGNWTHLLAIDDERSQEKSPEKNEYSVDSTAFTARLDHWLDVVRNGAPPVCTVQDGIMATAVLEALRESGETGHPVDIELYH
jgi:predicted dehydrogenase